MKLKKQDRLIVVYFGIISHKMIAVDRYLNKGISYTARILQQNQESPKQWGISYTVLHSQESTTQSGISYTVRNLLHSQEFPTQSGITYAVRNLIHSKESLT